MDLPLNRCGILLTEHNREDYVTQSLGERALLGRFHAKKSISLATRAYFLDSDDNAFSITIMAASDNRCSIRTHTSNLRSAQID